MYDLDQENGGHITQKVTKKQCWVRDQRCFEIKTRRKNENPIDFVHELKTKTIERDQDWS